MATEPINKIMREWKNERMTNEQALGYILQHLELIYQAQKEAGNRRHEITKQLGEAIKELKTLKADYDRLNKEKAEILTRIDNLEQVFTDLAAQLTQSLQDTTIKKKPTPKTTARKPKKQPPKKPQ